MSRLTQRVARDLDEIAERANVVPDAIESIRQRILAGDEVDAVAVIDEPSEETWRRPGMWLVAAAAAAVVLAVGMAVLTRDNDKSKLDTVVPPDREEPVIAPTTTSTTTTVPVDPWAFDIDYIEVDAGNAVAANEAFAWVAGSAAPVLSTIDLATNEVVSVTPIPEGAGTANFGFESVWISHSDGMVTRFDPVTETVVARIDVGGTGAWLQPGFDSVWVGTAGGGEVVRINPATNEVSARIPVLTAALAVGENASGVWVNNGITQVIRIDPETNTVVAAVDVAESRGMMVSPEAVWTPGGTTGFVYRIDPETSEVAAEIDVSAYFGFSVEPRGIHYAGGTIWVRYVHSCDGGLCTEGVVRIDPETDEIVATAELREGWPRGGMSVGPTTAWTWARDAVARFDFEQPESGTG